MKPGTRHRATMLAEKLMAADDRQESARTSLVGDLPRISRAKRTGPREAERMRRAFGIRTP